MLMDGESHNATRGLYNTWRAEMRKKMGGTFDWAKVSEADIRALSGACSTLLESQLIFEPNTTHGSNNSWGP